MYRRVTNQNDLFLELKTAFCSPALNYLSGVYSSWLATPLGITLGTLWNINHIHGYLILIHPDWHSCLVVHYRNYIHMASVNWCLLWYIWNLWYSWTLNIPALRQHYLLSPGLQRLPVFTEGSPLGFSRMMVLPCLQFPLFHFSPGEQSDGGFSGLMQHSKFIF